MALTSSVVIFAMAVGVAGAVHVVMQSVEPYAAVNL
jgi:hypothetical protein